MNARKILLCNLVWWWLELWGHPITLSKFQLRHQHLCFQGPQKVSGVIVYIESYSTLPILIPGSEIRSINKSLPMSRQQADRWARKRYFG
jgi:hypothetical protein